MFNGQRNKVAISTAVIALSFCASLRQPASADNHSNQSDVDAVKTSKDDNQHQVNQSKNSYKKGTPLPFEGPPAKSKAADAKSAKEPSKDKKP